MPALEAVPISATEEERKAIDERNKKLTSEQVKKNLSAILDAILEEHPEETMEILGLCCFVEPDHVDDYKVVDYLTALNSLISDKVVLDFFTSLASLGQMNISDVSKA
jgi:hypothetical protein